MSGAGDPGLEERELQAAEYVIGLLPPQQARAIEALALNDASVAASISAWETRLAPLAEMALPLSPPPVLWSRLAMATGIESVIGPAPLPRRSGAGRAWRSPIVWRAMTVGSMAVAASLAFLLLAKPVPGPEPLVAALTPYNTPGATFLVRVGAGGVATVLAMGNPAVPQGRALELWAVAGSAAPVSMGLLPESGRARLTLKLRRGRSCW